MKRLVIALLVLVVAGTAGIVEARRPAWQLIGKKSVTDRVDRDVITVTGARGQWTALRFAVRTRAVEFRSVRLIYANGTSESLPLQGVIRAGGDSRIFDLKGGGRTIQRIELRYDAKSLGGKAVVKVFGRR